MKTIMLVLISLAFFGCASDTVYTHYVNEATVQCKDRGGWKSFYVTGGSLVGYETVHTRCEDGVDITSKL